MIAVANRIFRGRPDLVLLEIDPAELDCTVVDENLEGGSDVVSSHLRASQDVCGSSHLWRSHATETENSAHYRSEKFTSTLT